MAEIGAPIGTPMCCRLTVVGVAEPARTRPRQRQRTEVDRNVLTGQNPASSAPLAAALLERLS